MIIWALWSAFILWFDHCSNSRAQICQTFRWYFGPDDDTKRTFWNKLTFSLLQFDENFFLTSTRSVEGPVKSVGFRIWVNSAWNMSSFALRHSVNGLVLYTNWLIYKVQKDKVCKDKVCKSYVATYVTKVDFRNCFFSIEFI